MPTIVVQGGADYYQKEDVRIPDWVVDLESFRRWADSDEFPEEGRIDYLKGEVWIDMSREQVFSHVQAKTAFTSVLYEVVQSGDLGLYLTDGLRLTNLDANLSGIPDGTFISDESMEEANIHLIEGADGGYTAIEGVPDMVLEVVSTSSVRKDTKQFFKAYWEAGIREYWLVDVRGDRLNFDIFRHTPKGYVATRKKEGWLKSQVFGKSFRLARAEDRFGNPRYALEVR